MNMQKYFLIFAAFVFGGLLLWYYVAPNAALAPETGQDTGQIVVKEPVVTISYTNEGYSPSEVDIKVGDTVRFSNDSSDQETWPASAVHPTHSIYPEKNEDDCLGSSFDACRGLKPGESWEFTFNEIGEWRFHDHIHASKTGVVNVSE